MITTVLFCQSNSIYYRLGRLYKCDVWDEKRNALHYDGMTACIHHPPCRLWSRMRSFSTADEYEKYLALWSIRHVRNNGGILEHPQASSLFKVANLPLPGHKDEWGFTIEVDQFHFGHKARKRTWLYICGISERHELLEYRRIPGSPKFTVSTSLDSDKKEIEKNLRSATPKKFARWLVKIVCKINNLKHENKKEFQREICEESFL